MIFQKGFHDLGNFKARSQLILANNRRLHRAFSYLVILIAVLASTAKAADVVVVKSKALSVYDKAVSGFQSLYKGSLSAIVMKGDLAVPSNLASAVRQQNPKVILAVGLRAVKVLKAEISNIPIVFCMAMHPEKNKLSTKNTTGVDLEPSPVNQLRAFKSVIPNLKKIGIIYDPKRTGPFVDAAKKAAPSVGLKLVAQSVSERKDVPGAFEKIVSNADALWIIRDPTVLTREFFNHTLIVQFEKKFPLLAYSVLYCCKSNRRRLNYCSHLSPPLIKE